jgi:hypothetical protein
MHYGLILCVNRDRNRRHPDFPLSCSPEVSRYHERVPAWEGVVWIPPVFIDNDLLSPLNLSACRRRGRSNKALSHKKSCTLALSNCLALSRRFSPFYPSTSYCTTIFLSVLTIFTSPLGFPLVSCAYSQHLPNAFSPHYIHDLGTQTYSHDTKRCSTLNGAQILRNCCVRKAWVSLYVYPNIGLIEHMYKLFDVITRAIT